MKVTLAKTAGFCFGVQRAVDTVYRVLEEEHEKPLDEQRSIYTYGPIVHNETVIQKLAAEGVQVLESEEELATLRDGIVIIRAHGVPKHIYELLEKQRVEAVDASCPFVQKIQRLVQRDILIYPATQLDEPADQETGTADSAGASSPAPASASTRPSAGTSDSCRKGYLYPADGGAPRSIPESAREPEVVDWVWTKRKRAGASTDKFPNAHCLYLSIRTGQQVYGVVGVSCSAKAPLDAFTSSILLSILGECALALESRHNAEEREKAAVLAKNEQLRANLLRSISHDLRTPLTSISGNADALLHSYQALDDDSRTQMITDIYDDAQWLTELVENLLAVTKISDGSVKLQLSDQVVDDIVAEALRHIDRHSTEHHITSDCGELIMQLLINLVNNAIKYSPAGSHIEIRAFREAEHAVIEVSDDGPGIPDAQKSQVFEMFYTGSKRVADSRRSLGLGLSLCRSIVHAHDGELTLRDNTPHGCIFSFTLPLSEINLNM